jgi:hypothetical protein
MLSALSIAGLGGREPLLKAVLLVRIRLHPDGFVQRVTEVIVGIGSRFALDRKHPLGSP